MYTFSNRCHEQDSLELGDETVKIFLNTKGTTGEIDEDVKKFLAYVDGKAAEGELAQDIAAEVERIKRHNETKVEYMTLMMELKEQRREGHQEGYRKGQHDERLNSIRNLMKTSNWTVQQAMDALLVPDTDRERYASQLEQYER